MQSYKNFSEFLKELGYSGKIFITLKKGDEYNTLFVGDQKVANTTKNFDMNEEFISKDGAKYPWLQNAELIEMDI